MKLTSLLGHSSELLRIIRKSHQPSDLLASDYFRKKKYIGSSERKFISELVFFILRGYGLFDYCLSHSNFNFEPEDNIDKELLIIFVALYIFENYNDYHKIFHPSQNLFNSFENKELDFLSNLKFSLTEKTGIDINYAETFFVSVHSAFNELELKVRQIINRNSVLDDNEIKTISSGFSIPAWILDKWLNNEYYKFKLNNACNLSESLLFPAPFTIRVNLSQASRDEIFHYLINMGIDCRLCKYSPMGITIMRRTQLNTLEIFRKGLIEVQDEGSQLISVALSPETGDRILDACAGAGGKSLHIADIIQNNGEIYAFDIDNRKLKELKRRAERSGFDSINTNNLFQIYKSNKKRLGYKNIKFDKVLVDAPCSGLGTVRRMPMQKWRLTPDLLKKYSVKQLKILEEYSKYVINGGTLVYSTCSLMAEENEEVVFNFLNRNSEFKPLSLKSAFDRFDITLDGLNDSDYMMRLLPHIHGCDGFFIAKFIKIYE